MERCPVCGSPVRAGANFCTACGHRLTSSERSAPAAPTAVVASPSAETVPQKPTSDIGLERAPAPAETAAATSANDVEKTAAESTTPAPWAMPAPAESRPVNDQPSGAAAPRASADLWPSPERAADPWGTPGSSAGVAGEPSREGYAAWDAAPSSWIGWNTPSQEEVEEKVLLETPETPAEAAEPTADQDETAPFAWPGEPGSGTETEPEQEEASAAAGPTIVEQPEAPETPEPTPGSDEEMLFVTEDDEPTTSAPDDEPTASAKEEVEPRQSAPDAAARDGWDAYIAARESARAQAAEGDVVAKGMSLVEQLRDLLPAIVLSEPATMRRVANDLINARNEASVVPQEDLDRLRGVLESSRDNPRDIEALMQLGRHATELLDLMGSFERYTGAVDRAVAELSRGGETAAIGGAAVAEELPPETDGTDGRS